MKKDLLKKSGYKEIYYKVIKTPKGEKLKKITFKEALDEKGQTMPHCPSCGRVLDLKHSYASSPKYLLMPAGVFYAPICEQCHLHEKKSREEE